jgi:hypothetical protein
VDGKREEFQPTWTGEMRNVQIGARMHFGREVALEKFQSLKLSEADLKKHVYPEMHRRVAEFMRHYAKEHKLFIPELLTDASAPTEQIARATPEG